MGKMGVKGIFMHLPLSMSLEISSILGGREGGEEELGELRIIAGGRCSIVHKRETLFLSYMPTEVEVDEILSKICAGGTYAYRDTIKKGYVAIENGIRVGVSGTARYDEGRLVGVSRVKTLIFRFPIGRCDFSDQLLRIYRRGIGSGMLIYSPPGVGKTTALRSLAEVISNEKRLCIIDERGEFSGERLPFASILSGYDKALGVEIALRTHSPEIIMVDELGADESEALRGVLGAGISIIATAHGGSIEDLLSRSATGDLIRAGFFSVFVGIHRKGDVYKLKRKRFGDIGDLIGGDGSRV
jgi:stage III sporulation protein AA